MGERRIIVSDHAVLRYLERDLGLDVEAARQTVEERCRRGADRAADTVLFGGLRYVLHHHEETTTVITVVPGHPHYVHRRDPNRSGGGV